jgi:hypothetical protein
MHTRPIPSTVEPLPVIGHGTNRNFDVGAAPAVETTTKRALTAAGDLACAPAVA